MSDPGSGFVFAFKVYKKTKNCNANETEDRRGFVDCLENLVHKITHSDIIHVEIIPVFGSAADASGTPYLRISQTAYSAYIGLGFDEHDSSFCITDPTYILVYIPMTLETTMFGIEYLRSQRGKQYNYLALPFTVLPSWCKKRTVSKPKTVVMDDPPTQIILHEGNDCREEMMPVNHDDGIFNHRCCYYYHYDDEEHDSLTPYEAKSTRDILLSPSRVFCSQLGLTLCYLCNVFPETYDFSSAFASRHVQEKPFFIDPMCCTPAELYRLLLSEHQPSLAIASQWPQSNVVLHEDR